MPLSNLRIAFAGRLTCVKADQRDKELGLDNAEFFISVISFLLV